MKTCEKFAQVKLRRGPDSVINIFQQEINVPL